MNELIIKGNEIEFTPSIITFKAYDKLMNEASQVAKFLKQMEVNEENVKEAKKIRASANKAINKLQDERKKIKKELLKPYEEFNTQIQEIAKVVDEANLHVDSQIKELEEKERDQKLNEINEIWNNQVLTFEYESLIKFEQFMKNEYLNKTYSLNKVEVELSEWFEKVKKDIDFLKSKNEEYVVEYLNTFDVIQSMSLVDERNKAKELLKNIEDDEIVEVIEDIPTAIFEIKGNAEIKLVERLLEENEINYKKL